MNEVIVTLGILVPIVTAASEYVGKFFEDFLKLKLDGKIAALKSWLVSIAVGVAVAAVDNAAFGDLLPLTWWQQGIVWGAVVAALSNGAFQLEQVKTFLTIIKARKK